MDELSVFSAILIRQLHECTFLSDDQHWEKSSVGGPTIEIHLRHLNKENQELFLLDVDQVGQFRISTTWINKMNELIKAQHIFVINLF